ncbi:MAG: transglycosylase SLT domain-containing protein, partial [Deltaproteobacteria bacterium]|nr:transglycosylase SLT domain-containing protein [Deltaproteobacteria bacterium]
HTGWVGLLAGLLAGWPASLSASRPSGMAGVITAALDGREVTCDPEGLVRASDWPAPMPSDLEELRRFYLMGKCRLLEGDAKGAYGFFTKGLEMDPTLGELWRLNMLRASILAGWEAETQNLVEALSQTVQYESAGELRDIVRSALNNNREGKDNDKIHRLKILGAYASGISPTLSDYNLLESLYELSVEYQDTRWAVSLPEVLWSIPKDRPSAEKWAAFMKKQPKDKVFLPPGRLFLARAKRLYELKMYQMLQHEVRFEEMGPATLQERRQLGDLYFKSLARMRVYGQLEAEAGIGSTLKRFSLTKKETYPYVIRMHISQQHLSQAENMVEKLEAMEPKSNGLAEIYLTLAEKARDKGKPEDMSRWSTRFIQGFPDNPKTADAYWMMAWWLYQQRAFSDSLAWLDAGLRDGKNWGGDDVARFYYWKGRIHGLLGEAEAARKTLLTLQSEWPASYYGLIAGKDTLGSAMRAMFASTRETGHQTANPPSLTAMWNMDSLRRAFFLYAMGEEILAQTELRHVMGKPLSPAVMDDLFQMFVYFRQYHQQQRLIANYYQGRLKSSAISDAPLWQYAYPRAFWSVVEKQTYGTRLNPYFVLAVMREESHFRVAVSSWAGAQGLMQLMPGTARQVARDHKIHIKSEDLHRPHVNIPLGAHYLESLRKLFDGNPIYMAAGYNAGPNALKKWIQKFGGLSMDEFVETIPYTETRRYVQKVFASYLIYQQVWGTPLE